MDVQALRRGRCAATTIVFVAVQLVAPSGPASANWWIIRSSDGMCVVVDIEPKDGDRNVTKVGKDAYRTRDEAEAEVKRLCKD